MMASALQELHLIEPPLDWILEENSTTTFENAVFTLQKLQGSEEDLAIVTNSFHQARAYRVFLCLAGKRNVFTINVPSNSVEIYNSLREVGALVYYMILGRLCDMGWTGRVA